MNTPEKRTVALIAGPTASGKSALALALAEALRADGGDGATIINADASQVYRDLRILSARPSDAEEARVAHRLFGYRDAADACSAADWAADATAAIADAHARGRMPILVGGTGLYIRTLIDGIAPVPEIAPAIREEVRALPLHKAFGALVREDRDAAERLRPTDTTRVARALEVVRSTGRTLAAWQEERVGGIGDAVTIDATILLPPREWLRARCDARFEDMMARGAAAEVTALIARGLDPELPAMRAIGVRDIAAWQAGEIDRETAVAQAQSATRRYAKRQYTWFRHQLPDAWERIETQLDVADIDELAIKLRKKLLTR